MNRKEQSTLVRQGFVMMGVLVLLGFMVGFLVAKVFG